MYKINTYSYNLLIQILISKSNNENNHNENVLTKTECWEDQ